MIKGSGHMDLIKIGKYIAFKRKEQGLTQKQLAEKLNMSDKSVSKWERGVSQTKGY
ncbi:MAG: helix-turn-helix domain-containing protein [Faecalibacillus intestinalis]